MTGVGRDAWRWPLGGPGRRASAGVAGALVVATLVVMSGWGGERTSIAVADLAAVVTALGGAVVLLRRDRTDTTHAPWRFLALAMVLWGAGELLWSWYEVVLGDEVPFPSVADVAYLGAVPFAVAGVLAFARGAGVRYRLRSVLDGCVVASSLLFVTWALVLGPAWRGGAGSAAADTINVAYPVTDLVLAVLALTIVQGAGTVHRRAVRTVAAALLVMAVTDSLFTWMTNHGTYSSTNPISMLWPVSYVLLALAATQRDAATPAGRPAAALTLSPFVAYVPLLAAVAVAGFRLLDGEPLGPFLTVDGAVLVSLVLVRQAITAWDLRTTVVALHERERELERLAHEDSLTGLANRARFGARLESLLGLGGADPAVVYIDLDGFKAVNDRFGHATGDALLVEVADRFRSCLSDRMLLARLGGDEFVVLVEDGHDAGLEVARRILQTFDVPFRRHGEGIPFHASIGVATAPAGGSPEEAVRRADAAMYVAKTNGKGRAVIYPDDDLVMGGADQPN